MQVAIPYRAPKFRTGIYARVDRLSKWPYESERPDKWEYPWYAAWYLAFHALPIAMIDPEWAKRQLTLMLPEWYMHPNGQIPAYVGWACTA
jgi:hypothetical protein